jgi:hypothetical protein
MNTISVKQLASEGAIDTVLTVFPDQQGRLSGKRLYHADLSRPGAAWLGSLHLSPRL